MQLIWQCAFLHCWILLPLLDPFIPRLPLLRWSLLQPRLPLLDFLSRSLATRFWHLLVLCLLQYLIKQGGWVEDLNLQSSVFAELGWQAAGQGLYCKGVHTPNRSEPISHRSRFYVVLRGGRGDLPACFSSSQAYWACVGRLSDETVTHGFPSKTEARIYVEAAGLEYPGLQ